MNTANKLTLLRVCLVPVFMILLMIGSTACTWAALGVFILASLTDMLDGHIARSRNQITTFGKFADPLADKILTTAAFLVFAGNGTYHPVSGTVALMVIMTREFAVAGIRLAAVGEGEVVAANIWGKLKTVAQMFAIIITIILCALVPKSAAANIVIEILLWITVGFTVISGADYLFQNWKFMKLK